MRAVLLAASVTVLFGCTTTEEQAPQGATPPSDGPEVADVPTARPGGTLRVALSGDPATLDPRFVADDEGELILGAVFEPLVRVDALGQVLPGAAERWEVDDEGRTFTFELREQSFHDGTPVTADDVVRTFARIADGTAEPPSFLAYLLEPVEGAAEALEGEPLRGVEALDERTVRITLREPHPRFLLVLADPALSPVPAVADEDPEGFATRPVGNGPFALAEAPEPGGFVRLTAVTEHHRRPTLDEVVFQIYPEDPDRERQWQDLQDGLLQVADVPPGRRDEAIAEYGTSSDGRSGPGVLDATTSTVYLLGFDLTRAPFDDEVVRRAISQSIDRDALADEVFGGVRRPADRLVPPGIPGSQAGVCDHCRVDPEGAAALLEAAEIDLGDGELTFTHNESAVHAAVAERVAADVAAALDVSVAVEELPLDEFVPTVRRGDAPWFRLGWDVDAADPGAYLEPLFHSRNVGTDNLSRYEDERTDELLDAGRAAASTAEAQGPYRDAERRILDAVAVAPLLFEERGKVVVPGVQGLRWDVTGRVDLAQVRLTGDA